MKILQRRILALFIAIVVGVVCGVCSPSLAAVPGGTLNPVNVPKFVTPLVIPPVMPNTGITTSSPQADLDIAVRQFKQQILPGGIWNTVTGGTNAYPATTVWSYGSASDPMPDSTAVGGGAGIAPAGNSSFNYPAFTVENSANVMKKVRWTNELVQDPIACFYGTPNATSCNYLPHLLPVDQTLHWANPGFADCTPHGAVTNPKRTDCETLNQLPYMGPVPIVTHVHGAHVNPESDGYPEAWWLADADNIPGIYKMGGTRFGQWTIDGPNSVAGSAFYAYENSQEATTLWYHDHSMGMTRLNVYAGPAGFWLIRGGAHGDGFVDNIATAANPNDGVLPGPAPVAGDAILDLNTPASVKRNSIREIPVVIQDRSFDWVDAAGNPVPEGDPAALGTELWYPTSRVDFDGFTGPYLGDPAGSLSDISKIWNPEAFFNTMVVNGVTWPNFNVAQERYRFRLLNGCNSRTLNLHMEVSSSADPMFPVGMEIPFFQIGGDQGFLPAVTMIQTGVMQQLTPGAALPAVTPTPGDLRAMLLMPAERADVIVDFTGIPSGTKIRVFNNADDAPFGGLDPTAVADPATTGQVMEFVVDSTVNQGDLSTAVTDLVLPPDVPLGAPTAPARKLSLNEMISDTTCIALDAVGGFVQFISATTPFDPVACDNAAKAINAAYIGELAGPRQALLGQITTDPVSGIMSAVPERWMDPISTNPLLGSTEVWELYNTTADAHPIHVHLVRYEIVNRQDINIDPVTGGITLVDAVANPAALTTPRFNELGFKDTVIAYPGQVTRLKAKFDIPGLYVWHCHIVEHEDNEMMLPFTVQDVPVPAPATITVPSLSTTGDFLVSWAASTDPAATYTLEESIDNFATYPANSTVVTSGLTATSATITGKTDGNYYYRVKGVNPPYLDSAWTTGANGCTVAIPVGIAPPVFTSPTSGAAFDLGSTIPLTVTPSPGPGLTTINLVGFYEGTAPLGFAAAAPYTYNWTPTTGGAKSVTATVFYSNGQSATSVALPLTINGTVATPGAVTVPASSTTGSYSVSWVASATLGVTYTLEESTDPTFATGVTTTLNAVSPVNITATVNGTFYYRVIASKAPMADSAPSVGGNGCVVDRPASGASMTFSPLTSQVTGGIVTLTGAGTGGSGNYEYQYWAKLGTGAWQLLRGWSTINPFDWNTTGFASGSYTVQINVRNQGSTSPFGVWTNYTYSITEPPVTGASLSFSPLTSQDAGGIVTLTGAGTGGSGNYEYQYYAKLGTGAWQLLRGWSTVNPFDWNTTGFAPGSYTVQINVRNQGSTSAYGVWTNYQYKITTPPATGASMAFSPLVSQTAGGTVTLTGAGTGGTGTYEYQYWARLGTGAWQLLRGWSTVNPFVWNTTGFVAGPYTVQVNVRSQGSNSPFGVWTNYSYTLN